MTSDIDLLAQKIINRAEVRLADSYVKRALPAHLLDPQVQAELDRETVINAMGPEKFEELTAQQLYLQLSPGERRKLKVRKGERK